MPKKAISVTLDEANLLWLRGQSARWRSVSETLDHLVTRARTGGDADLACRSVVGTIDIDQSDPLLESADSVVRAQFEASVRRPLAVATAQGPWRSRRARRR